MITGQSVYFSAPGHVTVEEERLAPPCACEVLVQTRMSAISAGTESLVFQGLAPETLASENISDARRRDFRFPFKYGYSCVGEIIGLGPGMEEDWLNRRVFAFNPHESHFITNKSNLILLPDGLSDEDAVFLANMETAISFVHDGAPLMGESVLVVGLGVVGMLTLAQLSRFPLAHLYGMDRYPRRREIASGLGDITILDADDIKGTGDIRSVLAKRGFADRGADLVYEISGSPDALNLAISAAGYHGRVVIGSWYGRKKAVLDLGGAFHHNRIQLISSQVSSLAPEISGRWSKNRRMALAIESLQRFKPSRWISHRYPLSQVDQAYQQLVLHPDDSFQIVLTY